ncbi:MAG: primosomal protein N' [Flavobacteriaceae bacterium]|nr:primosomal protein N' [Flavobacteriaceae bacterium]|tara:strand:+ start:4862 stop:7309 length:2448 start_codon:yes stop_codon:yes gene_type:complete
MSFYIDVLLPFPLKNFYTYRISEEEFKFIKKGFRVLVPFGGKRVFTSIVIKKHKNIPDNYEPKEIFAFQDDLPIVDKNQIFFWKWMSNYYQCPMGSILKASIPSSFLLTSETLLEKNLNKQVDYKKISDDEILILDALDLKKIKIDEVRLILNKKNIFPAVNNLIEKGYIKSIESIKEKYKPKLVKYIKIYKRYSELKNKNNHYLELKNSPRKRKIIEYILKNNSGTEWIEYSLLKRKCKLNSSILKKMISLNILSEKIVHEDRFKVNFTKTSELIKLSKPQLLAKEKILEIWKQNSTVLFEGVTSSGKTEVYSHLINRFLKKGFQILFMMPEISLTIQMVSRLKKIFGKYLSVYHSKFSNEERFEVWNNVIKNKENARIVVGARSSIFLPFQNLKLIVVDEEHDSSFKQENPAPRYNARDSSIKLSKIHNAKLILGSATPSLESKFNALNKKYGYVKLTEKYGLSTSSEIKCVDMKIYYRANKMKGLLTPELYDAIQNKLLLGQQILLFQNRRGYAPVIECITCGHIPKCRNCDVSLTFHQYSNSLKCHYCGFSEINQKKCLKCSSSKIDMKGYGTQQIEEQIKSFFPKARVDRMDWDTTRGKYSVDKIFEKFENSQIDVLIGTQMITKGLDFKNIGLVGVINADNILFFPNFRANEKAFQVLTQVAGRAGRSSIKGSVIIQTFSSDNNIFELIKKQNHDGFYKKEIAERNQFNYPPYYRLIKIIIKSRDLDTLRIASNWLFQSLSNGFIYPIYGPFDPHISKIKNEFIKQILIKYPNTTVRNKVKKHLMKSVESFESIAKFRIVKLNVDVDPN